MSDSKNYIYLPQEGKITGILKFILDESRRRNNQMAALGAGQSHPSYFLTLDTLAAILHKETGIKEEDKSPFSVSEALNQMMDSYTGGENKYGYLYPVLIPEGNKISTKIIILAPGNERKLAIKPYRDSFFNYSKKVIDQMFSSRAKKSIAENKDDINLIRQGKKGTEWFYPKFLSIENELVTLLKRSFKPYNYIPMNDFMEDFITYGMNSGRLTEVSPDYHIIQEKIELNENNEFAKTPELLLHLRAQVESLEAFAAKHFIQIAEQNRFTLFQGQVRTHLDKYGALKNQNPEELKERLDSLLNIIDGFPGDISSNEKNRELISVCNESANIAIKLYGKIGTVQKEKEKVISARFTKNLFEKIDDYNKDKQLLYILETDAVIQSSNISDPQVKFELEKEIKRIINNKYGFFEAKTQDGKEFLYVINPSYMSYIIFNLTKLSVENPIYSKQLEIAKVIQAKLIETNHPDLDSAISDTEKDRITKQQEQLLQLEESKKRKAEFRNSFNIYAAVFGFVVSMIYFIAMYSAYDDFSFLIFSIPTSAIIAIVLGFLFRKKPFFSGNKKEENKEEENDDPISSNDTDKTNQIIRASVNFIFKPKFNTIQERIFDRNSLKQTIKENLSLIKSNSAVFSKEKNDEKILSTIENAILFHSALILVPKEIVPRNKSSMIILERSDLKAPLLRAQIAEHFKFLSAAAKNSDSTLSNYYNYIYQAVERDYFKYIKGNNLSKIRVQ